MVIDDAAENPRREDRLEAALSEEIAHIVVTQTDAGDETGAAASKPWANRLGLAGSLALHGLALYLLFYAFHTALPPVMLTILPVELVMSAETTAPEPARQAAAAQRRSAAPVPPTPRAVPQPQQQLASLPPPRLAPPPVVVPPPVPETPRDALQDKLEALSNARVPETGNSTATANGGGTRSGPEAYSVRDYVRAQVERRWTPNTTGLRNRNVSVAIHVVLERDGTVMLAEIVDQKRTETDPAYYLLALSARNAVRLASPIALPAGSGPDDLDMVLNLNPATLLR